jgi:hypothetical protein
MKMKWSMPLPSFQTIRIMYFACIVFCVLGAYLAVERWLAMLDSALAGFNLGALVYTFQQQRSQQLIEEMLACMRSMAETNEELIANRTQALINDTPEEFRPRLH